jgi:hypothetical protein
MVGGGETNDKCVLSDKQMLPGFTVKNKKINKKSSRKEQIIKRLIDSKGF